MQLKIWLYVRQFIKLFYLSIDKRFSEPMSQIVFALLILERNPTRGLSYLATYKSK